MREHKLLPQRDLIPISTTLIGQIGACISCDSEVIVEHVLVNGDGIGIGITKGLVDEEEGEVEVDLGMSG